MSLCKACDEALVLRVDGSNADDDDQDGEGNGEGNGPSNADTVPDNLELRCGCHFHWYVRLLLCAGRVYLDLLQQLNLGAGNA